MLLVMEDSVLITGRGRVLAPGLPSTAKLFVKAGDAARLIRPDGSVTDTVIQGVEAVHLRRVEQPQMIFMITLPKAVTADETPKGTRLVLCTSAGPLVPEVGHGAAVECSD